VAVWGFCHPSKLKEFETWTKKHVKKNLKTEVFLSEEQLKKVQAALGFDGAGRPFFEIIYQHSGQLINVPPGWAHTVINLRVCDVRKLELYLKYIV
jgi:hypothetical protein